MTYKEYKNAALSENPELRAEYDELGPIYDLIDKIVALRIEKKMTQEELARLIHTRQSNISRLESGNYNPSVDFLQRIAGALGKNLEISLR